MSEYEDLLGRLQFRIEKFSNPGWLMDNCIADLNDAKHTIESLQARVEELEGKITDTNVVIRQISADNVRLNAVLDRLGNATPLTDNFLHDKLKCVQDELKARIEYARNRGESDE